MKSKSDGVQTLATDCDQVKGEGELHSANSLCLAWGYRSAWLKKNRWSHSAKTSYSRIRSTFRGNWSTPINFKTIVRLKIRRKKYFASSLWLTIQHIRLNHCEISDDAILDYLRSLACHGRQGRSLWFVKPFQNRNGYGFPTQYYLERYDHTLDCFYSAEIHQPPRFSTMTSITK